MIEVTANGVRWRVEENYGPALIEFLNRRSDDTHSIDELSRPGPVVTSTGDMRSPAVTAVMKVGKKGNKRGK